MSHSNFLLFRAAGRTLALSSELTRQVVPIEHIFSVPGAAGALLGLIPAAGRALPLVDLAALAGLEPGNNELALICEVAGEQLALPVTEVIGVIQEENIPQNTNLLSEETLLGGYFGGGHKGQVINPQTLLRSLQERILPS
ncbi:chemotaxis protein CheW [Deinococcus sp.]|uniref:chemotaxis protein CheW n=1 Tax=Deinococcus sp. TaxID=47478 RepID=UPI0025C2DE67|nr:chemotaxis protein CheW [Deinococcus sp.]